MHEKERKRVYDISRSWKEQFLMTQNPNQRTEPCREEDHQSARPRPSVNNVKEESHVLGQSSDAQIVFEMSDTAVCRVVILQMKKASHSSTKQFQHSTTSYHLSRDASSVKLAL
jgi:hypothetical protein